MEASASTNGAATSVPGRSHQSPHTKNRTLTTWYMSLFVSRRNDIEFGRAGRVNQVTCEGARQSKDATGNVVLGTAKLDQIRIRRAVVFVFIVNRVQRVVIRHRGQKGWI